MQSDHNCCRHPLVKTTGVRPEILSHPNSTVTCKNTDCGCDLNFAIKDVPACVLVVVGVPGAVGMIL